MVQNSSFARLILIENRSNTRKKIDFIFCIYYYFLFKLKQLCDCGYIPILLSLISDADILKYRDEDDQENKEQLLKMCLNLIHNIAQQPETKVMFRENKATNVNS